MTRILIATQPAPGHVNPFLPVASTLSRRGHQVAWYTGAKFKTKVERTGAHHVPIVHGLDFNGEGPLSEQLEALLPERKHLRGVAAEKFDLKTVMLDAAVGATRDMSTWLDTHPTDVLMSDLETTGAALVAEKRNVPRAILGITPLLIPSRDVGPPGIGGPSTSRLGRIRNRLLNGLMHRVLLRDINRHADVVREQVGLPSGGLNFLETAYRAQVVMQATVPEFEYPRSDQKDVQFVGPLIPPPPDSFEPPLWWADLDGSRPVVVVTQGTVRGEANELISPTVRGLADEDVLVVAAGTDSVEAGGSNTRAAAFIPFHHLLPRADVFVTNGGYGGVHFALSHGVPIISAGRTEDKVDVCARVAWSGVGLDLKVHIPKPKQIKNAVRRVLADTSYRSAAAAIGATFVNYDAAASVADSVERMASLTAN